MFLILNIFSFPYSSQSLQKSQTETLIAETEQKLTDLNAQKLNVEELIRQNEALGQGITCLVETRATAKEYSKFQLHIEDIDKITSLLVSLSGRLARVESSINDLEQDEDDSNGQKVSTYSMNIFDFFFIVKIFFNHELVM